MSEHDEIKKVSKKSKTDGKKFYMSHTTLTDYLTCQRYYWFKTIRRLELDRLHLPFLVGRVVHTGISHVLSGAANVIALTKKELEREIKETIKKFPAIKADEQEKLYLLRLSIPGMLKAYMSKYGKFIREMHHLESEIPFEYDLGNGVVIVGKIDNLLRSKTKKVFLHELKSSTYITVEYVRAIQTDMQTSLYYHVLKDNPELIKKYGTIAGIIYDVQKKPSIKQKKGETRPEFEHRLSEWYDVFDGQQKFHQETITSPKITKEGLLNTYRRVSHEIRQKKTKEEFYQNFGSCVRSWGFCEHYKLCHEGGETKQNLIEFRTRERHKVQKGK